MPIKKKDNRKKIDVELSDEEFLRLAKEAHKKDITFNQLVEIKLQKVIENYEKQPYTK